MARLDSSPGTYALILSSSVDRTIQVGKLGKLEVRPGFYVYVGSAFGPGGLTARVSRHAEQTKKLRWHVDYLRAVTRLEEVWYTFDETRRECPWVKVIRQMRGAAILMSGFGASDCDCHAHLFFFAKNPSLGTFRRRLRDLIPEHGRVHSAARNQPRPVIIARKRTQNSGSPHCH